MTYRPPNKVTIEVTSQADKVFAVLTLYDFPPDALSRTLQVQREVERFMTIFPDYRSIAVTYERDG